MKINAITSIPLSIPVDFGGRPGAIGSLGAGALTTLLVRVETDDGTVGWGDAFSYSCLHAVRAAVDTMVAPAATGREVDDIATFSRTLQQELHLFGRYGITLFALSGLDIALWDIAAKQRGQSLATLLGSRQRDRVDAYASLFRYADPDQVASRCTDAVADGYRYIKLHEIAEREVAAAREASGALPIMVDTNCPWTLSEARRMADTFKPYDIYWLEEPLFPPEDFAGLASLQADSGIDIAAGENACTVHEFRKMLEAGAVRYPQPSVTKVGGVSEFVAVTALAESFGAHPMPHSPYFGPGFLATLQLAAVQTSEPLLERFYGTPEASLYGDAINPVDGAYSIPDGPGLGMEPDENVIRDYRVD